MQNKSIAELTKIMVEFTEARGWKDAPNTLALATIVEMAELAEHFQWKTEFEELSEEKKREIGFEFVDVIFYLFRLAQRSGIDIEKSFFEKLPKLAAKFPVGGDHAKAHDDYRKSGKNRLYE